MRNRDKKRGTLFWITGLSGSGKTQLAKKISKKISKSFGPTIVISGDDIRKIFSLNKYEVKDRLKIAKSYGKLAKFITNRKINIIFAVVGMFDEVRKWNRKNIKNYIEIYLKSNLNDIINFNKKKIYQKKETNNIVGLDIKPEIPKKPDIIIINNFKDSLDVIAKKLLKTLAKWE